MIYNTTGTVAADQVRVSGGNVSFSAATSGSYRGITIFQDRSLALPVQLSGGTTMEMGGAIYAINAELILSPSTLLTAGPIAAALVVSYTKLSGSGTVLVAPATNAPAVPNVNLVE
jgi:hypothetical protein